MLTVIFAYRLVPETKGRTLEAIEAFGRRSGGIMKQPALCPKSQTDS